MCLIYEKENRIQNRGERQKKSSHSVWVNRKSNTRASNDRIVSVRLKCSNFNENYMKSSSRITFNRYFAAELLAFSLTHSLFNFLLPLHSVQLASRVCSHNLYVHFAIFHVHFESNENSTVSIKFRGRLSSYFFLLLVLLLICYHCVY